MKNFNFWQKWLLIVGVVMAIFGIYMSLSSGTYLFRIFDNNIIPVFWNTAKITQNALKFQKWVYGAWGATVAGWSIFLIFITHYPFKQKQKWAWKCLLSGLLVWYFLDTAFSWYFKVYINVALNSTILLLVVVPLFFTRKEFQNGTQ
ncbi:MAG: hypothetical protein V1652_01915 [bacterium]